MRRLRLIYKINYTHTHAHKGVNAGFGFEVHDYLDLCSASKTAKVEESMSVSSDVSNFFGVWNTFTLESHKSANCVPGKVPASVAFCNRIVRVFNLPEY